MNKFFDSPECRSGSHCRTCRAQTGGAAFRTSIAAYFSLPSTNWDCPHGRVWGLDNKPESLPFVANQATARRASAGRAGAAPAAEATATASTASTTAQKPASLIPSNAEEICHACASRACPNVTVCCGGQVSVTIMAPCPEGRW